MDNCSIPIFSLFNMAFLYIPLSFSGRNVSTKRVTAACVGFFGRDIVRMDVSNLFISTDQKKTFESFATFGFEYVIIACKP